MRMPLFIALLLTMIGPAFADLSTITLLNNASATGSTMEWPGGEGEFAVAGTFGGATVKLQVLGPDGVTWIDAGTNTTFTASNAGIFKAAHCFIRAAIVGGSPSGIYAIAQRVGG